MIDNDYEIFLNDKSFYKQVTKLQNADDIEIFGTIKKTFSGHHNFPESFVSAIDTYKNLEIEVKEYAQNYSQHLRVLHKFTKMDFFNGLCPVNNEEGLKLLFDESAEKGDYPEFTTTNRKFIIRNVAKKTKDFLLKSFIIPYHKHVMENSSFISRILGIFSIKVK